ncbi:MAG: class I SAM-dependent methyltransferase [Armatimonadia bacterium]
MNDDVVGSYWDRNAHLWARQVRAGYDTYREYYNTPAFVAFIGDISGRTVLDAGCGEGYNTRIFARSGATLTGVDVSEQMIELARDEEAREPLGIRYEVSSVNDLSLFTADSFDMIVSTMALMDCADYNGAIAEFARVLRPGGTLAFSVTHPCFANDPREWHRDEDGNACELVTGPYRQSPRVVEWSFGAAPGYEREPFTVPVFSRTLTEYFNPLAPNGFCLERLLEPEPTEKACQKEPRLRKHKCFPQSMMVMARHGGK